jgi:hypothetical protein
MPVPPPPLELLVPLEPVPDDPPPLVEPLLLEPLPVDPPLLVEPLPEEPLLVEPPPLPELGPPLEPEEFPAVPEEPLLPDKLQPPGPDVPHPPPAHRPARSKQPNAAASLARGLERRPGIGRMFPLMRGGPEMAHGESHAGVLGESR